MNRDQLLKILEEQVENKNIIKHMLATEVCMAALAKRLGVDNEQDWATAGLMHDGDYRDDVPVEQQGIKIAEVLKEKGMEVSEAIAHAMAAHNWDNTGVEPESPMDWALYCCDSLTGLIVATCLVLPSRKMADVTLERVQNRFKEKNFAKGTRRDEIALCEEKLGIPLNEFMEICLKAMQSISDDLGL